MSLEINIQRVTAVLLADGWHAVDPGTFDLDAYEFMYPHPNPDRDDIYVHLGGKSGVCATGYTFTEATGEHGGQAVFGPLTAILAVRYDRTSTAGDG